MCPRTWHNLNLIFIFYLLSSHDITFKNNYNFIKNTCVMLLIMLRIDSEINDEGNGAVIVKQKLRRPTPVEYLFLTDKINNT